VIENGQALDSRIRNRGLFRRRWRCYLQLAVTDEPGAVGPPAAPAAERKLATALFADLVDSTGLGEQDPERVRAILDRFYDAMAEEVERAGGTIEKFAGDAVMAAFGAPAAQEDHAERALHTALAMQRRLRELFGTGLELRIGVNTGEVVVGESRAGSSFMSGDAVNVAARLEQAAEPGEVLVGERTATAAARAFELGEPITVEAKGKPQGLRCRRLVRELPTAAPRRVPGLATRLVGRERELTLLETLYHGVIAESRPRLATLLGDAGVGKTRLTEEFLARARSAGDVAVYRGRCLAYGEGITYWALREILWDAAGITLDDPGAVAAEKVFSLVREHVEGAAPDGEAERVAFALATSAGIALPANPFDRLPPESIGEELGLAWPRLLGALAASRPTLLVVEDLHWAEPPLLDMVEHLVSRSTGPALIVATARPELAELRPNWSSRPGMSLIGLEPLAGHDADALVAELLPRARKALRGQVLAAAEGNPFFAEEIVRHLADEGVLVREDGELVEGAPTAALTLPDTVRALLAARVDALPPEEKRVLQDASVIGRTFWITTLEAMRTGATARERLHALEDKGLVVTRPASSLPFQTELAFRHGLTRDVAYQSIPRAARAPAHAEVARWIEELAGDRREEFAELIAHHYESAARPEDAELAWPDDAALREQLLVRAVAALLEAGRAALNRYAIDAAIGFAERARALAAAGAELLAALELRADACGAGVRIDEAWSAYMEGLELAERLGARDALWRMRANSTLLWARYALAFATEEWKPRAREIVERGLEELGEDATSFEAGALLVGRACFTWTDIARRSAGESRRDAERAVAIAEALDSELLLSYAVDVLSGAAEMAGWCDAEEIAGRAAALGGSMIDRVAAHELLVTAAWLRSESGDFSAAAPLAHEAAAQAAGLSSHHRLHAAQVQIAHLVPTGRLTDAHDATSDVVDLVLEEGGHTCFRGAVALAGRAAALSERGDGDEARRTIEVLDEARPKSGPIRHAPDVILRLVLAPDQARRRLNALEPGVMLADRVYRVRAELELEALAGDWERVGQLGEEARLLARSACVPYLAAIADWADAVRLAVTGRSEEAAYKGLEATAALEAYGDRYAAARLLVDLLPSLARADARELAEKVAAKLDAMGALKGAADARAYA
jgi:class 3 adenylate cyclase